MMRKSQRLGRKGKHQRHGRGFECRSQQTRSNPRRKALGIANAFQQLQWPVSYLDFESVMTALPLYDDMPPYRQVTTQYTGASGPTRNFVTLSIWPILCVIARRS